jgi:PAS domain S-box-containing protein
MSLSGERRDPRKAGAVVWLAVILSVLLAFAAYWVLHELAMSRQLREQMQHSYGSRSLLGQAYSDVRDAEIAQRGYLMSGDARFLNAYETARADVPVRLAALDKSFADRDDQRARAAKLRGLIDAKFQEMNEALALRRSGRTQDAQATASGPGRRLTEEVRAAVGEIREVETRRIDDDIDRDRRRADQTEEIVLALFLALAAGALASVVLIRRYAEARYSLLQASRSEAARERAVFEAAMDGILILNRDLEVERANPAAERMFGRSPGELNGVRAADLFAEDPERVFAPVEEEASARGGFRREVTGVRKDRSQFPLELSLADTKVEGLGVLLFTRDISDRRHVERLKDEFVSTVSHELRTPLTSIAGSLGLVAGGAAGELPEKAARLISIAQSNSQRLVRLINDVLDLEKLESGKLPFQFSVLDVRDVAQRAIDGVRGYADQLGVELLLADGPSAPVRGDPDRLVQVVTNLLSNAAKYSPPGEAVRVKVERDGSNVRLSVTDRGPGVPEAFRDRIFTRFAQADSSDTRIKGGTGLGLYIAREIAERHGGRLWFESPQGGGAAFHLELPLIEDLPVRYAPRDRVLLVEDEPAAAALLTAIMEHEGLKTDSASNLAEAREALADPGRFGAIVLDLRLPDGDGMDLVKQLRSQPETRGIPVVVVSADAARGHDPAVRTLEVVDWMEKPVDPDRLTDLVRAALTAQEPAGNVILHVDDDRDIRAVVATALADAGEVVSVETLAQARAFLAERTPSLVILDLELRDGSGLELLQDLKDESVPVIVFSAQDAQGDFGRQVTAVLVKSRTSLAGLVGAVRDLVDQKERTT